MAAPPRVTLGKIPKSDTGTLQKPLNRPPSSQRILNTRFLGEKLQPPPASCAPGCTSGPDGTNGPLTSSEMELNHPWLEEFQCRAEEEKKVALKLQEERLQARFLEALRARERLEAEARQGLRVELKAQLEARYVGLKTRMEEEKRTAVQEACGRMQEEAKRQAELEKEEQRRVMQEQMEEHVKQCVSTAEQRVWEECKNEAAKERRTLQDKHKGELSQLQDRLQQLQDSLVQVCRERRQYEAEFKKVQASYRQFIDLTDSSLHSDYLLKLRRLGKEPGLSQASTQTDDASSTSFVL